MSPDPSNPAPSALLRIDDLAVSFDNGAGPRARAVDGVRLTIYPRQTLAVVGESGCGKSVTALSVLRLLPAPPARYDRGRILFRPDAGAPEIDLLTLDARMLRQVRGNQIAMIFQEPMTSLNPVYTVGDQILEAILLHQGVRERDAMGLAVQAMRDVGIAEPERRLRSYPHEFSGGMRQRVMIAMALACNPKVLLADEPTTALDVTIQAQILRLLRDLRRTRGLAVMLISHALGVVAENADIVCVMYGGRVVEYARVFDLFDRPLHPYTRGLLASMPRMGERRDRLRTIRDIIDDPAQWLGDGIGGLRPWWPEHEAPPGLIDDARSTAGHILAEAEPQHWVGAWCTPAAAACARRDPDICYVVPSDPDRVTSAATALAQ